MQQINKLIRNGQVAILVSPGFGAGWSTWAGDEHREFALFDHRLVECLESGGDVGALVTEILGENEYFYTGGARDLVIEWLPVGTPFKINEYDGFESLEVRDGDQWSVA